MITIRDFEDRDIKHAISLCKEHFYAVSMPDRFNSFDKETAIQTLRNLFKSKDSVKMLVALEDNKYVGICVYLIQPSIFNSKELKCVEFLWYVTDKLKEIKRGKVFIDLFRQMKTWWGSVGATSVHIGLPVNSNIERFLKKQGFKNTEVILSMEV